VQKLIDRLTYHKADVEGRLLRGMKFEPIPVKDPEGQSDLPVIRLWVPTIRESYRGASLGTGEMTLNLTVSTRRSEGLVKLLEKVELVMDALETSNTGLVDPGLDGTLVRPFNVSLGGSFVLDLSLNAQLSITAAPKQFERGGRQ
jgi:hypothetical protein